MSILVVSPHFDDAILSAGQFIQGRNDITVLTVFSGMPDRTVKTEYDKSCGFKNSRMAMEARRWEDGQATALLGADWYHLGLHDSQYPEFEGYDKIEERLTKVIAEGNYAKIVGPLGLRHPDHVAVSDALLNMELPELFLYEDIPARVTHPEVVVERIENILENLELEFIGDGSMEHKIRALLCYKSQVNRGDLNPFNLYVPERFWKVS